MELDKFTCISIFFLYLYIRMYKTYKCEELGIKRIPNETIHIISKILSNKYVSSGLRWILLIFHAIFTVSKMGYSTIALLTEIFGKSKPQKSLKDRSVSNVIKWSMLDMLRILDTISYTILRLDQKAKELDPNGNWFKKLLSVKFKGDFEEFEDECNEIIDKDLFESTTVLDIANIWCSLTILTKKLVSESKVDVDVEKEIGSLSILNWNIVKNNLDVGKIESTKYSDYIESKIEGDIILYSKREIKERKFQIIRNIEGNVQHIKEVGGKGFNITYKDHDEEGKSDMYTSDDYTKKGNLSDDDIVYLSKRDLDSDDLKKANMTIGYGYKKRENKRYEIIKGNMKNKIPEELTKDMLKKYNLSEDELNKVNLNKTDYEAKRKIYEQEYLIYKRNNERIINKSEYKDFLRMILPYYKKNFFDWFSEFIKNFDYRTISGMVNLKTYENKPNYYNIDAANSRILIDNFSILDTYKHYLNNIVDIYVIQKVVPSKLKLDNTLAEYQERFCEKIDTMQRNIIYFYFEESFNVNIGNILRNETVNVKWELENKYIDKEIYVNRKLSNLMFLDSISDNEIKKKTQREKYFNEEMFRAKNMKEIDLNSTLGFIGITSIYDVIKFSLSILPEKVRTILWNSNTSTNLFDEILGLLAGLVLGPTYMAKKGLSGKTKAELIKEYIKLEGVEDDLFINKIIKEQKYDIEAEGLKKMKKKEDEKEEFNIFATTKEFKEKQVQEDIKKISLVKEQWEKKSIKGGSDRLSSKKKIKFLLDNLGKAPKVPKDPKLTRRYIENIKNKNPDNTVIINVPATTKKDRNIINKSPKRKQISKKRFNNLQFNYKKYKESNINVNIIPPIEGNTYKKDIFNIISKNKEKIENIIDKSDELKQNERTAIYTGLYAGKVFKNDLKDAWRDKVHKVLCKLSVRTEIIGTYLSEATNMTLILLYFLSRTRTIVWEKYLSFKKDNPKSEYKDFCEFVNPKNRIKFYARGKKI